jgi:hypothetical protein
MPRLIEIKTGNTLTITGPARCSVYGNPALSGTQPVPQEDHSNGHSAPATAASSTAGHKAA